MPVLPTLSEESLTPAVSQRIGTAYRVVNEVYKNLALIKQISEGFHDFDLNAEEAINARNGAEGFKNISVENAEATGLDRIQTGEDVVTVTQLKEDVTELKNEAVQQVELATDQAEIATEQAVIAADKAVLTAADRVQTGADVLAASVARDAAQLNAGVYVDTTAGISATTDGEYFSIVAPDDNEYLILYLNSLGVAVEQKKYPSVLSVERVIAGNYSDLGFIFKKLTAESGYSYALVDSANRAAILVGLDGSVTFPKYSLQTTVEGLVTDVELLNSGEFGSLGFKFKALALESGYAYALTDSEGKSVLMVGFDGTVTIPKYNKDVFIPQELLVDTGYVWGILDSLKRIALGIKTDGTLFFKNSNYLVPSRNLWCNGDSLTAGAGSQITWREALPALLTIPRTITNNAIGGQTSTQIAARAGAYFDLLTVTGDLIPTSGAVSVTARTVSLITSQGAQSLVGTLNGIEGTLARDGSGNYTFTRTTAGTATYTHPKTPFIPSVQSHYFDTQIIFLGRNNLTLPSDIIRDIELCVNLQTTVEKRFLIITPPNGGTITPGVSTNEGTGTSTLTNIKTIEDWAVQKYGDRVLKSREFSFQFNNGSADDLDDVAKETVPRSLRIDTVHWTTALHAQVAAWVASQINSRGW